MPYDLANNDLRSWHEAVPSFRDGTDTPRAFLEHCLEIVAAREADIKAFVCMDIEAARVAADEAAARYREGRALSVLDGMPYGVKDLFKTADFATAIASELFEGGRDSHWLDSAHVYALRKGGAVLLGKTTLPELGSGDPPPTRNPYDLSRSPGASSSGSAAAVGAGMVPVATGSQGRGSILRPASFCGNWALKPTFGALHSGGLLWRSPAYSVMGVHGGSLEDCWAVARQIADIVGGDPGHPGLYGGADIGEGEKPARLALLETAGWERAEEQYKTKLLDFVQRLAGRGVDIVTRADDEAIEALERALAALPDYQPIIAAWEIKWPALPARDLGRDKINPRLVARFEEGERMTLDDYRGALARLEELRAAFAATRGLADGCLTLSSPAMPPVGMGTGDSVFGDPSSALGAPAWNLPLMEDRGLPMGVQLLGQPHRDFDLARIAKWMAGTGI